MLYKRVQRQIINICVLTFVFTNASGAEAAVNLEWRMNPSKLFVGDTVEVGLYAVSDSEQEESVAAIQVILSWDPSVLTLTGLNNNGPHNWLASYFPPDSNLSGLNDTWADGNALYNALPQPSPNPPAMATPEGLLVTTIVFQAIHKSEASELYILDEYIGAQFTTYSRVIAYEPVGQPITGTLGSIFIEILPCGFSGDIDFDCGIDLDDYQQFYPCRTGPDRIVQIIPCLTSDLDGDQDVDLMDYQIFQLLFNGN